MASIIGLGGEVGCWPFCLVCPLITPQIGVWCLHMSGSLTVTSYVSLPCSQYFICMFALLINKVSPQDTVVGVIGGSVLLPCSSAEDDVQVQDCTVFWRHNDSKIVFDIVNGKDSLAEQNQEYKNRTESFPDEYPRKNFSIILNNLKQTDTGEFSCVITPTDEHKSVQLIIKVQDNKEEDGGGNNVGRSTSLLWILSPIPVVVIGLIILYWRKVKKAEAPEFSHVDRGGDTEH